LLNRRYFGNADGGIAATIDIRLDEICHPVAKAM
jgi:hypothetical protein